LFYSFIDLLELKKTGSVAVAAYASHKTATDHPRDWGRLALEGIENIVPVIKLL
jgi:hypothetical protein